MDTYRPTRVVRFLAKLLSVFYRLGWVISGVLLVVVAFGEIGGTGFALSVPAAVDFHDARLQSTWTGRDGGLSLQETDTTLRVPLAATPVPFRIATFVLVVAGLAILLLVLYHLRELFRRARDGAPFDPGNAVRLRWIAGLILAGHFLDVVVGGLLGRIVLATLTDSSVALRPTLWLDQRFLFGFNEGLIVFALILFALAEIFKRGAELEDDQSLVVLAMAIRVTLDRLLEKRGVTLTELADRTGMTLANLSILKTNKARAIRFSTLEALCRELDCQPRDLFSYESPSARSRADRALRDG